MVNSIKRALPPELCDIDRRIEAWKTSLLQELHSDPYCSVHLLCTSACERIAVEQQRCHSPEDCTSIELLIRYYLFAIQFALYSLATIRFPIRSRTGVDDCEPDDALARRAESVLQQLIYYVTARDCFITYMWGGYGLESVGTNRLVFVDTENWIGADDRAHVSLDTIAKIDAIASGRDNEFNLPHALSINGLGASAFARAWQVLKGKLSHCWACGLPLEIGRTALEVILSNEAHLSASEIEAFIRLTVFDITGRQKRLTLFHCPLIPLDDSTFMILPPALFAANLNTVILRLGVLRSRDPDSFAKAYVAHLLDKLAAHFRQPDVEPRLNVSYNDAVDSGDIDLVIYESSTNRLLLAQVKAFVQPDSVEEVVRTNEQLVDGFAQAERVRQWYLRDPEAAIRTLIPGRPISGCPCVCHALIGNGSVGSDPIRAGKDIATADIRFLLTSSFRGTSCIDAILAYEQELTRRAATFRGTLGRSEFTLADVEFSIPVWEESIGGQA